MRPDYHSNERQCCLVDWVIRACPVSVVVTSVPGNLNEFLVGPKTFEGSRAMIWMLFPFVAL